MPQEEQLNINERFKVLSLCQREYRKASRSEKTALLDQWESLFGLHRKSLIRRLNGLCERRPRRVQRQRTYDHRVDDALRLIWESHNQICAELLQPNLVGMAETLAQHGEMELDEALREQLERISTSSVRRRLERISQDEPRLPRPPSGSTWQARSQIPIGRIPWSEKEPGHFEVDLVHHCGPETKGEYVYTLHMVDVATGWVEPAALLGRSGRAMVDAFTRCEHRLPFQVLEIHSDNGAEFFVDHMERYWKERAHMPHRSRSRFHHSNDNRFVEHRNGALIRAWIGHDRLDTTAQTLALNQIYDLLWCYHNLFQPIMRLTSKEKTESGRIRRRYDTARTPFERLKVSGVLSEQEIEILVQRRSQINPRALRQELLKAIEALFKLPMAQEGQTEDVFATFLQSE
jgi:hypothetical protein